MTSVLSIVHRIFKKHKIPEELYRKIFKYINMNTIQMNTTDSCLLSLFYSNKDIILNMEKLKNSVIFCKSIDCEIFK